MIIIINGPLGVGKTETSWKLLEKFDRAVMLDGDYLGAVRPFRIDDPERVDYLHRTIHHLAAFHYANGYRNLVINYVFEEPESLADLRRRLAALDDRIYAFRLAADPQEISERVRLRAQGLGLSDEELAWELKRGPELLAIQERAARRGDLGFAVDTTGLDAEAAAQTIWQIANETVELQEYDPAWEESYARERERIAAALGDLVLEIHHIGSTSVPGLAAKPIIDILVVMEGLEDAKTCIAPLAELGYTFIDHPENVARRYFRKGVPRSHHLHIVAAGSAEHRDPLDFRDALRADPDLLAAYASLKSALAAAHRHDRSGYTENKSDFVRQALVEWRRKVNYTGR